MNAAASNIIDGATLRLLGGAIRTSARSLHILRAIDETISALGFHKRHADNFLTEVQRSYDAINSPDFKQVFANEDRICHALEAAQDSTAIVISEFEVKLKAARCDTSLAHDDGVCEAFEDALESFVALNNLLEDLRWAVMEHTADMAGHVVNEAKLCRTGSDIDAMLASIRS